MPNLGPTELIIILFLCLLILVPYVLFYMKLQHVLGQCVPENRTMKPGHVWLILIPLFNIVWQFIIVSRIASTLENEFHSRNTSIEPNPGKNIGIAWCILSLTGIIPIIGIITLLVGLCCWIIYWVRIAKYSKKLASIQYSTATR